MQLGFDLGEDEVEQEDSKTVLKQLSTTCTNCRLSLLHPANRGMIYRGNLNARIAVVGIAPGPTETEKGSAMIGPSGKLFEQWMRYINIDTRTEVFITNICQCSPPSKEIDGKLKQRDPEKDEINACFGPRCLRVLRTMPNLQVIITLGWLPARVILGTKNDTDTPKTKTHEGQWFTTSLLPGVAVFCLSHPAELLHMEGDGKNKKMVIQGYLDCFKREYLDTDKVIKLIKAVESREVVDVV
jgi:uracil-DNA glycosylase family 4